MTVTSTNRKAGPFDGNDVTVLFPFVFHLDDLTDLRVVMADPDMVETDLVQGVDYTATLNADQDSSPGGEVTLTDPLATDYVLVITSDVPALQETLVTNGGGFYPDVFNAVFDRLTILIQQVLLTLTRSFTAPITSSVTDFEVPVVGSGVLQWNADGTALEAVTLPDLALQLALPSMTGHSGHFLTNNGSAASWGAAVTSIGGASGVLTAAQAKTALAIAVGDITDYATDQATKATALRGFSIAAALVF